MIYLSETIRLSEWLSHQVTVTVTMILYISIFFRPLRHHCLAIQCTFAPTLGAETETLLLLAQPPEEPSGKRSSGSPTSMCFGIESKKHPPVCQVFRLCCRRSYSLSSSYQKLSHRFQLEQSHLRANACRWGPGSKRSHCRAERLPQDSTQHSTINSEIEKKLRKYKATNQFWLRLNSKIKEAKQAIGQAAKLPILLLILCMTAVVGLSVTNCFDPLLVLDLSSYFWSSSPVPSFFTHTASFISRFPVFLFSTSTFVHLSLSDRSPYSKSGRRSLLIATVHEKVHQLQVSAEPIKYELVR